MPNIMKYMDLSTGHITEWDDHMIEMDTRGLVFASHRYGYFVWVPEKEDQEAYFKSILKLGYSEALCNVLRYAREHGCNWVNFDSDAFVCEDLPTHDW